MKTLNQVLPKLTRAERAWLLIGPRKYRWTVGDIRKWVFGSRARYTAAELRRYMV